MGEQSTSQPATETPSCPDCGAAMQLRTARRGRNAGGQFYGCSKYPRCRGTLPFNGNGNGEGTAVAPTPPPAESIATPEDIPRPVAATPSHSGTRAALFECAALPRRAISFAATDELPLPTVRALSQWQLDYPH